MKRTLFGLTIVLALGIAPAAAQEKPSKTLLTVDHYLDWEQVGDPQIAPDGGRTIYTRELIDKMADRWDSSLWIMDADGGRNRFLARGSSARWSPDGTRIAYLADGAPGGSQIYVRWMDAEGATSQVTHVAESPGNLRWSPDGRRIAFTLQVERKESWTIDLPKAPKGASWTEPPRLIETTHYRQDRQGFLKEGYLHIFVVPAEGGTPRQVTEGEWNVGNRSFGIPDAVGIDWGADGKEIYFDGLRQEVDLSHYFESHIHAVEVATGKIRQLTKERGPWSTPLVSPDGRLVAFIGMPWTEQTYKAEDIYVMDREGKDVRRLTGDLDRDPANLFWAPDGSGIYFTAEDRGSANIHFAPLAGKHRAVTQGAQVLSLRSLARGGVAAGTRSSPDTPGELVRIDLAAGAGKVTTLARVNDDVLEGIRLGKVEETWYDSTSAGARTKVQGWLVSPPDFDASKKYPLILHIHGGPNAMYNVAFSYSFQNLAANGYLVLYTNPRGSTGYGTAFGNAIDDDYPGVDHHDLMAGVDAVVARGIVDTTRMYVTGVSGGGVLSAWATSHDDRFAAAAVRAPVINWISFAGTTDITAWGYFRYRGRFWDNPDRWLSHSPLMHVAKVKTPTLMICGELDLRTPMAQTEEYYQALRAAGVETALLRFNGEYHGTASKPSNFMRTQLYLMSWFAKHTKG